MIKLTGIKHDKRNDDDDGDNFFNYHLSRFKFNQLINYNSIKIGFFFPLIFHQKLVKTKLKLKM
jgi:hypothetical protein